MIYQSYINEKPDIKPREIRLLHNFTVVIPVENSLVRNYWVKFSSQNYWLDIIQKSLNLRMFFGIQPICNLKLKYGAVTKIHVFVKELAC